MGTRVTQSVETHTVRMSLPRTVTPHPSRRSARPARLDSLTGLRFFAAGIVFLHHGFELTTGTLREAMLAVFGHGRAGVSFFFLLSGFVLAWSMQPGDRATSFWRRRFARLWPAYAVATVAGYVVCRYFDGRPFSLERLAANLAMVQSWIPAKDWYFSVNAVNWSLSVEAFFYLTFPLYAAAILRMRAGQAMVLAGVLFGGILTAALLVGRDLVLGGGWMLPDAPAIWVLYVSPAVRILEFLLGIVMVTLVRRGALPRVPVALAWSALAVGWVVAGKVPASFAVVAVTVLPFCLLILAYAQTDVAAPRTTLWSSRGLVFLGNISFCFYLVHQLVMRVFVVEVGPAWLSVSTGVRSLKVLILVLAVSLVAAWLLHVCVEKPGERLLRGRAPRSARPDTRLPDTRLPDAHVPDARRPAAGHPAPRPDGSRQAYVGGPVLEVSGPRPRSG
jgi:peptidoglycan/LPS O-acetylase OafA/YrhL